MKVNWRGVFPAVCTQFAPDYGLDVPLRRQYLNYWKGVLHGDLGPSLRFNQSVSSLIAQRYPFTLQLTVASLVLALAISIPAGVRSAKHRNGWDDRLLSVISLFGLSFPNFALGPVRDSAWEMALSTIPACSATSSRFC